MAERAAAGLALAALVAAGAAHGTEPPPDPELLEFIAEWSDAAGGTLDPLALELALDAARRLAQAGEAGEVEEDEEHE